eukprot:2388961-Karenia_brevis.AAC.1
MANYTNREGCACNDKYCKRDKWIQPVDTQNMILDFQVAEVSKPLLAVKWIVEKGSRVIFGPGKEDNFIFNSKT